MTYFKIGTKDFSKYVNELKVSRSANYNAQTNANGDTVIDYINTKRTIEVGIIPLTDTEAKELLSSLSNINVSISYMEPQTNTIASNVNCIIPEREIEYYTIQDNKVLLKVFTLTFIEL